MIFFVFHFPLKLVYCKGIFGFIFCKIHVIENFPEWGYQNWRTANTVFDFAILNTVSYFGKKTVHGNLHFFTFFFFEQNWRTARGFSDLFFAKYTVLGNSQNGGTKTGLLQEPCPKIFRINV